MRRASVIIRLLLFLFVSAAAQAKVEVKGGGDTLTLEAVSAKIQGLLKKRLLRSPDTHSPALLAENVGSTQLRRADTEEKAACSYEIDHQKSKFIRIKK